MALSFLRRASAVGAAFLTAGVPAASSAQTAPRALLPSDFSSLAGTEVGFRYVPARGAQQAQYCNRKTEMLRGLARYGFHQVILMLPNTNPGQMPAGYIGSEELIVANGALGQTIQLGTGTPDANGNPQRACFNADSVNERFIRVSNPRDFLGVIDGPGALFTGSRSETVCRGLGNNEIGRPYRPFNYMMEQLHAQGFALEGYFRNNFITAAGQQEAAFDLYFSNSTTGVAVNIYAFSGCAATVYVGYGATFNTRSPGVAFESNQSR
ncbi:MAG: hypothetical protein O9270_03065 [Aquidulcibacter sp.]|jgi:hypothetical protein|uniref:hypothetical protein n=1 Tax=Aquidulcibacter sp. TaxID=2052990 RepID=UPI0022BEA301|nr:hypothetical protein [Aquidulcibacter sp.]MCZ8207156.1 hypothetical protein [Aquidulcibacter sp.]